VPDQLADFCNDLVHGFVRFAAIDFPLEPMPESLDRMVLGAVRRKRLEGFVANIDQRVFEGESPPIGG
jgi:hypothetical protein